MRRRILIGSVAVIVAGCASAPTFQVQRAAPEDSAAQQILLTVRQENGSAAVGLTGAPGKRYLRRRGYQATPAIERALNQLAREHGLERIEGWPIHSLGVYCEVLEIASGDSVESVIERLSADPRVDLAQRMNIFETLASRYDDPYAEMQFAVRDLGVEQAHRLATGRGVTVAIIDSAVDRAHPDLKGRVHLTRDLVNSPTPPRRGELHGTAVAGVIASLVDNSEGIIGVAPEVNIAALRACWPLAAKGGGTYCSSFTLAQALEVAIQIKPQIINLSLAGPFDPLLARLLDEATRRGSVIVAAHPEVGSLRGAFPASHPRVIVARSPEGPASAISPYTLIAPANEILTTAPASQYAFLSGNSLAAAHVTGVIALLLERDPSIDADSAANLLSSTAQTTISACRALETLLGTHVCDGELTPLQHVAL